MRKKEMINWVLANIPLYGFQVEEKSVKELKKIISDWKKGDEILGNIEKQAEKFGN